jgi:membrane-associated phospholipid phosphatase
MTSNVLAGSAACAGRGRGRERALLVTLLFGGFFIGYYAIAAYVDPARARSLRTPLDDAIPFVAESIYFYAWVYTALFLPLFVVRCQALFRRVIAAYALAVGVSLLVFALYPVGAAGLRPDVATLDPSHFTTWAVRLTYHFDPPVNLFPSVHLAVATLAALIAGTARRGYGLAAGVVVAIIAVSVCSVKQHYVVDGIAGLGLGLAAWLLLVRGHRCVACDALHYAWRGPALYLVVHFSIYGAVFAAFLSGFAPWD